MGLFDFLFGNKEEERLEELRAQEAAIVKLGEGAMEIKANELEQIREEINELKIKNQDNEAIQSGFAPNSNTGIFGIPQETNVLENIKRSGVNAGLDYVGAPDIVNYDTGKDVIDTLQQEGFGEAADTALNLIKKGFIQEGIKHAAGANIPVSVIMALAKNRFTGPFIQPPLSDIGTMTSDLTFGQGPKVWNWMNQPFDLFGGTGIFGNQQNIVDVNQSVDQQPSVIDQYIESLNQPTTTQNNDGAQTISGGTNDPSDDITVTNLPTQVYQPTMADIAGPSLPNTAPPGYSPNPYSGYSPNPHLAQGGLVSMARVLRR